MSRYRDKNRALARDTGFFKDYRRFIIACDDTYAPAQYFGFLRLPRVQVIVIPAGPGGPAARHALDNLLKCEYEDYDERWLLLDVDRFDQGSHVKTFRQVIQDAKDANVRVALSKPCFETWLLLHHADSDRLSGKMTCNEVIDDIRGILGEYNKTALNPVHYPFRRMQLAIDRTGQLDQDEYQIPTTNTTRVGQLMKAITSRLDYWQQLVSNS